MGCIAIRVCNINKLLNIYPLSMYAYQLIIYNKIKKTDPIHGQTTDQPGKTGDLDEPDSFAQSHECPD